MIRIGMVGCGFIAQNAHLPALQKAEGVILDSICERDPELLQAVATRFGIKEKYIHLDEFLNRKDLDAVLIATHDPTHLPMIKACAEAGKAVLVEKPLTMNVAESENVVQIVKDSGIQVQIGFMKRYDPGVENAVQYINTEMGERLAVDAWYCDSFLRPEIQKGFLQPTFQSKMPLPSIVDPKADLKAYKLRTHGAHLVDLVRFLGGEVEGLHAMYVERDGNFNWQVILRYKDGTSGTLDLTITAKMDWFEGFHVFGVNGSVTAEMKFPFFLQPANIKITDSNRREIRTPLFPDSDAYKRQIEAFAHNIETSTPVTPNVWDGLACQQILDAIERSANVNKWIDLLPPKKEK
jgi:predicted dehydrogenase